MIDEELIARLRQHDGWVTLEAHTHLTAADRIEALTKERERLEGKLEELQDRLDTANKARAHVMSLAVKRQSRAFALETKLAKAVEALGHIVDLAEDSDDCVANKARAAIAEIKGESHE